MVITSNVATCTIGVHQGVVIGLHVLVCHFVCTYYIVCHETIVVNDANDEYSCLNFIHRVANKVYEWLDKSIICRKVLVKLLFVDHKESHTVLQFIR